MMLLARKEARKLDITDYLTQCDEEEMPAGMFVSMEERVCPVRVVECFLGAGIPLLKRNSLRSLLEEKGLKLTPSCHLSDCIPPLFQEKEKVCGELKGTFISCIFDGTPCNWEALAVVMYFIKKWKVEQHLVHLLLLTKPIHGDELAREILPVLSQNWEWLAATSCLYDGWYICK